MIEQHHYGNDVPTGPIPVIPPQAAPASARPPAIPAPRTESIPPPDPEVAEPSSSGRFRWLLALLVVLCVVATLVVVGLPSLF